VIDWLKIRYPYRADGLIPADRLARITPDGEVVWQRVCRHELRGSFDQALQVSCCAYSGELLVDGNPAKFFQGHNLFGTERLRGLAMATLAAVVDRLQLPAAESVLTSTALGDFELLRVDLTQMYSLDALANVRAALRGLHGRAVVKHRAHGRGEMKGGTLYFGKHSRRVGQKFYGKLDEVTERGHTLPDDLPGRTKLLEWVAPMLRHEVVVRAMELKRRGLEKGSAWCDTTCATLYSEMREKLQIPEVLELPSATLEGLPGRLQLAYDAWRRGSDLRAQLSRRTFFRYRAELLKHGLDISIPQPADPLSNVVPLVRVLEMRPVGVPEWAIGTALYFEPEAAA